MAKASLYHIFIRQLKQTGIAIRLPIAPKGITMWLFSPEGCLWRGWRISLSYTTNSAAKVNLAADVAPKRNLKQLLFAINNPIIQIGEDENQIKLDMKKGLLGSLIGISIIFSIDSLSRVIISLYENEDILMFSYSLYPGFWPVLLVAIAAFSTFFGAMFALTYGREKQIFSLILFILLVGLYRYSQIVLLDDTEGLLFPVVALVVSLFSIFIAWKLVRPSKPKKEVDELDLPNQKQHHHPVDDDQQYNQPQ